MSSQKKRKIIAEMIRNGNFISQVDLCEALRASGCETTQSSISRDLRKLGVIKRGGIYRLPEILPIDNRSIQSLQIRMAGDSIIVLKSLPGSASRVALLIDEANIPEIAGTIAGDDTVFVAITGPSLQPQVSKAIFDIFD